VILLDTCVLLWLGSDPEEISLVVRQRMEDGATKVFISAISAFEIGQKAVRGRVKLPQPVDQWFAAMLTHHQLDELPVTSRIAALATRLPPRHRDPFDRLLIATALEHRLSLVTPDDKISQYSEIQSLW